MARKIKLFFKWLFVFSVLTIWSYFIIVEAVNGSLAKEIDTLVYIQTPILTEKISSPELMNALIKDFNVPIYSETYAGVEKASSLQIIDILFNHDFEIAEKTETIPMDRCSLRAKDGNLNVSGESFSNNKLSFNVNYLANGEGSLIAQNDEDRFSLDFEVQEILETNSEKLVLRAEGNGRLNREEFNFNKIIVSFNKESNKVGINGEGDFEFKGENMEVSFMEGCSEEEKEFYLITDNGKRGEKRSIEEVRHLLDAHPELVGMYEGLERLYKDYWWVALPAGMIS